MLTLFAPCTVLRVVLGTAFPGQLKAMKVERMLLTVGA